METLSCALPSEKEHSTCIELLVQLVTMVYVLVLVWFSRIIPSKVKGARGWLCAYGLVTIL
jgi:hypothetical protein